MDDFGPNELAAIERDRDNIDADAKPYDWADPELWNDDDEPDYEAMTDSELAKTLRVLWADPASDSEAIILTENEICGRANIPRDETEQGLTETAVAMIDRWIRTRDA